MNSEETNKKARSRRRFLKESVALAGFAAVGIAQTARAETPEASSATPPVPGTDQLQAPGSQMYSDSLLPYGERATFEAAVRTFDPNMNGYYAMTPLQDSNGIITPSGLHFIKRPGGGYPVIDPKEHRLLIEGFVERPLSYSVDELKRMPSVSRIYADECIGNTGVQARKDAASIQDCYGRVSGSEWTGVKLSTLMKESGLKKEAKFLFFEGADAGRRFRAYPLTAMMSDDLEVLIAYGQNGEAVRPENGYPLRLLIPGWPGDSHVKWMRRIEVLDEIRMGQVELKSFTDPSSRWGPMPVRSVITYPCAGGKDLQGSGFYEISGLAWTGKGSITRVEVSTDGGKTYQDAELQEPVLKRALTRFRFPWTWNGEQTVIQSRATDTAGEVQPLYGEKRPVKGPGQGGAVMPWRVTREGKLLNELALTVGKPAPERSGG